MKTALLVSSLILTAGYPALVVAVMLGAGPLPVPTLYQVIGTYTVLGLLAFAFADYDRRPRSLARELEPKTPRSATLLFAQPAQPRESSAAIDLKAA
jgi:hypothetical protein